MCVSGVRRGLKFPLRGGPHYHLSNVIVYVCGRVRTTSQAGSPEGLESIIGLMSAFD